MLPSTLPVPVHQALLHSQLAQAQQSTRPQAQRSTWIQASKLLCSCTHKLV